MTGNEMDWAAYVAAASVVHGLSIEGARRDEVIVQLSRLHAHAQGFLEFPLPPEVEPAPVFRPSELPS